MNSQKNNTEKDKRHYNTAGRKWSILWFVFFSFFVVLLITGAKYQWWYKLFPDSKQEQVTYSPPKDTDKEKKAKEEKQEILDKKEQAHEIVTNQNDEESDIAIDHIQQEKDPEKVIEWVRKEEELFRELLAAEMPEQFMADYPYIEYFREETQKHGLSLPFVLALTRVLSNFRPEYEIDGKVGLMRVAWPLLSDDISLDSRKNLRDPELNIATACSVLAELMAKNPEVIILPVLRYLYQNSDYVTFECNEKDRRTIDRIREKIKGILKKPYKATVDSPIAEFLTQPLSTRFIKSLAEHPDIFLEIEKRKGVYIVLLITESEEERDFQLQKIQELTGFSFNNIINTAETDG
jgi:flagellar basal body-associated protein FliL